jgi:hypothetical protein
MQFEQAITWLADLLASRVNYEGPNLPTTGSLSGGLARQLERFDPVPTPWRSAVVQLAQAAQAKSLATRLHDTQKVLMTRSADATIGAILDDVCGTPSRHWPWPGPPPWAWHIASELTSLANSVQPGELRESLFDIAKKAAELALAAPSARA